MRHFLFVGLIAVCSCAEPASEPAVPTPPTSMPHRRQPPAAPFSANRALLSDRVVEALERYDRDRWELFGDAMDPGERFSDLRVSEGEIRDGKWRVEWLFLLGDELFERDFTTADGFGPGRRRVHEGAAGGPDALSCNECHHRGGFDGAGDLSQNAFFDGDGYAPESAFERNAPHVLGLGPVQRLGEEMTAELTRARASAIAGAKVSKKSDTLPLRSKGVSFGTITAHPDGTVDYSDVKGVLDDLVVRPFGWKGSQSKIADFVVDGLQRHHGMQADGKPLPGKGPHYDPDGDGNANEITGGMVATMSTYLSLLEVPVMIPPTDPGLLERHGKGRGLFERIGCAECHRESLPIGDPKLQVTDYLEVDVFEESEEPRVRRDVFTSFGTPVYLFSDLRLHEMGAELSEPRPTSHGVPASVFLTRSLWGVADTAPYLHDGRAATLDEAILAHGGEAKASRDAFAALSKDEKVAVRIFLLSLTRYPRIEFR